MQHKKLVACAFAGILAVAMACSKSSQTPVSPSAAEPGTTTAYPDGSTLKATVPVPQSPVNGAQPDGTLVLVATKARGKFADITPSYEFEVKNAAGTTVYSRVTGGAGAGDNVQHTVDGALEFDSPHTWRVRAVFAGALGSWSSSASFRTASGGYIRGNEVFDPLTNGRTVGDVVGPVTFIPGVGVRLEDFSSHIRYRLPQTLVNGEFSLIITGVATNTEGGKTKVFAMSEGLDDIVLNDRRMTVEKRGDPEGIVAWRFISHEDQIDTEGAEREFVGFDANVPYLWTATWNGFFNVRIQRGGPGGPTIYSKGKGYRGAYDPDPHFAFIGAPIGRTGPEGATVPGMIVRQVWISPRPRPAGLQ
ncbi:MAG: hypothetical protein LC753_13210 [Acidobacteria bacterium]|nr:hypothetical protein [Acidobacteriota bacterium]MCA1651185.1 hypothetical protein [Acidobacteriota bacterium]